MQTPVLMFGVPGTVGFVLRFLVAFFVLAFIVISNRNFQ